MDILSMNPAELSEVMENLGRPAYRAAQVFDWLHNKNVSSFAEMENLPLSLRDELEARFHIPEVRITEKRESRDGTVKYLFYLDGVFVESVLMSYKHGQSICVSTQAGCRMGCKFCASATGLLRNLTAGEMCSQVYNARSGGAVKSIVLMGCGEPLDNFDAAVRFVELVTHPKGMNIGQRHITVSTCGLVPQIRALAELRLQINLAVSLHAPTDEIRETLMPVAKSYPIGELLSACRYYAEKTRRRLTFEYAPVKGLNSSPAHAAALSKLLRGLLCHVNLIPMNKARGEFEAASNSETAAFAEILRENKIPVTVRRSLGADIDGACGQLRGNYTSNNAVIL